MRFELLLLMFTKLFVQKWFSNKRAKDLTLVHIPQNKFTAEQKEVLEKSYAEKTHLSKNEREKLAEILGVEIKRVDV